MKRSKELGATMSREIRIDCVYRLKGSKRSRLRNGRVYTALCREARHVCLSDVQCRGKEPPLFEDASQQRSNSPYPRKSRR